MVVGEQATTFYRGVDFTGTGFIVVTNIGVTRGDDVARADSHLEWPTLAEEPEWNFRDC